MSDKPFDDTSAQLTLDDINLALELTTRARDRLALGRPPSSALVPLERAQQELRQARARVRDGLGLWPDMVGGTVQSVDGSVRDGPVSSHELAIDPELTEPHASLTYACKLLGCTPDELCDACVPGPGPNCDDCNVADLIDHVSPETRQTEEDDK